jgi:hypothetical protein
MIKIAIIILHFNDRKLTDNCLSSVKKLSVKDFKLETIVVNNNPKQKIDSLKKGYKDVIFLKTKENIGFTGGNNLGIKKALENKADFIFLLNNDTLLSENLLTELLKVAKGDKQVGILAPKIYFAPGHEFHHDRYQEKERGKVFWYAGGLFDWQNIIASHRGVDEVDHGQYDKIIPTDFVSGCGMLIRREVFEKTGFFDERYFLYLEDVDLCQRAKMAGFKILYVPQAVLWHLNAGSSTVGGFLHDYYLTRNRLLFGFSYALLRTKIALFKESLRLLFSGRFWQKRGVWDFYFRKFGQGSFKP